MLANADVKHISSSESSSDDDPHSTSLYATKHISAGDEILLDYGGGGQRSLFNSKLILDYGFFVPENSAEIRSDADFFPAIRTVDDARIVMGDVLE